MSDDKDFFEQKTRILGVSPNAGQPAGPGNGPEQSAADTATRVLKTSDTEHRGGPHNPGSSSAPAKENQTPPTANRTQVWRPGGQETSNPSSGETLHGAAEHADDVSFVVGWVVILDGPGKGKSFPLDYGWNQIGRETGQAICLAFGDQQISRENHCSITYDGKNRKYYIQHGGGRNITYLNDQPVLAPFEIEDNATIILGNTTLKLVKFCDQAFDWQDTGKAPQEQ